MRGGRGLPPIYHNITYIIKPAEAFDLPPIWCEKKQQAADPQQKHIHISEFIQ
jgi:hypothetical protein